MGKEIIYVNGMSCVNCANGIKLQLEKKGLKNINVNFTIGKVEYDKHEKIHIEKIKKILKKLGYSIKKAEKKHSNKLNSTEKYFYICLVFSIPLFSHMFLAKENILNNPLMQIILCIPVYIIGVLHFGRSAWYSIKNKMPNMDVLIFIGSTAAFIYSIYGWMVYINSIELHNYLFFETTSTIITLVLLGNLLEEKSINNTTSSIKELSKMQQTKAKKEINGKIEEITFKQTKKGDILIVNSGDLMPTDGIIISGECYVDESMISGENKSIKKEKNNEVIGGTIIIDGNIRIQVTKNTDETVLSQIIRLVQEAQNNKPNIQKIGDKISAIFIPIVITISILTFFITYFWVSITLQEALLRSIAVLVISCPCAMGLATPTAVIVAIGRAAKNGILIKGGDTLEKLAEIKNIVFDKTGTLTTGDFRILEIENLTSDEEKIKSIIYNIEKHSSHPIAKSLCKAFINNRTTVKVKDIYEEKGIGISGIIENKKYTIRSTPTKMEEDKNDLVLMKESKVIAKIKIADEIRNGVIDLIKQLKKKDYDIFLLSGDKKNKCEEINKELNIENIFYEKNPIEKINIINQLTIKNSTMMIGDGINDAPALAKSTVGVSLSNATQIAIQSADVILLENNLSNLSKAITLGKESLLTIKQNLFWAFSYNIIAIPLAISGMINPMWAALFMAFSDVIVIGNSIRLRYKKIFY